MLHMVFLAAMRAISLPNRIILAAGAGNNDTFKHCTTLPCGRRARKDRAHLFADETQGICGGASGNKWGREENFDKAIALTLDLRCERGGERLLHTLYTTHAVHRHALNIIRRFQRV